MLKPAPVTVASEIVSLVPPVFVSESITVTLPPTWTPPKARLAGFAVNWPGVTALPDKGKFMVGLEASEVNATLPLTVPAD